MLADRRDPAMSELDAAEAALCDALVRAFAELRDDPDAIEAFCERVRTDLTNASCSGTRKMPCLGPSKDRSRR